jgi:NADH-quinone oxidoreductase subunit K
MVPVDHVVGLACLLFALGATAVVRRRHLLVVLFGLQLMTSAAALVLVAFNRHWAGRALAAGEPASLDGQAFAFVALAMGAVHLLVGIGLALVVVRRQQVADVDELKLLGSGLE